jgi:sodium/potassium-transporting ATPase subunit alpha
MQDPKLNSSLIRNYIQASQQIDLQIEQDRQAKMTNIKNNRQMRDEKTRAEKAGGSSDSIKDMDQHRITWGQLCSRLQVEESSIFSTGLSSQQAKQRNLDQGDNVLSVKSQTPWYIKLLKELTSAFSLMLWAGSALCFIAYGLDQSDPSNMYLGIVLAMVVLISGIFTFFQNAKSESIMEGFKNFIPQKCIVIRDGIEAEIQASKLTTGDIVLLKEGGKIPADIRIIESKEMRVDNSSLTGESDPLLRSPECTEPEKILETKNVAFFGTICKEGRGKGMVFNIGDNTVIGKIASLADSASNQQDSPLKREVDRFIKYITVIASSLGILFFCLGFILKYNAISNLVFAIGIIVANVPEGLIATITIALSVASMRMHAKKVLVKNLESVETLGSTSCICSDKTGTLTQNKMTIENIFYDGKIFKGHNKEKMGPRFSYEYDQNSASFTALKDAAIVGSEAFFSNSIPDKFQARIDALDKNSKRYKEDAAKIEKEWEELYKNMPYYEKPVNGDASETAIVKFFQPIEDILDTRKRFPLGKQKDGSESKVPFNSAHKFALKVVRCQTPSSEWCVFLKGAPERVWEKCSKVLYQGRDTPLDKDQMKLINHANVSFAKGGQRILGFAKYHLPRDLYPHNHKFDFKGPYNLDIPMDCLTFIGLVSLIDPPREAVPDAIKKCKTAGIKVIMVTGDQQLTAAAIAKQIGIFEDETSVELQERVGCSYEEAVEKARAIVVNGEMLTKAIAEDEGLPENKKGKKLEKWLLKPQIVFARTSPSQKLYIVKGCQKLGHIVAVTGDGVNDSPAINQADIGIAMGITGSDVAKDSADMVLLNDDFSGIIMGIEEGRKIFDNLKKCIVYALTSNIPELWPFIIFVILQIPLPLSSILVLCICIGTDMLPAISFSYEVAELDIMTRRPRYKDEHLVTANMLTYSYTQVGTLQTLAGMLCYCVTMNDFGMNVYNMFYTAILPYYPHAPADTYDPNHKYYGHSNIEAFESSPGTWDLRLINTSPDFVKGRLYGDTESGPRYLDWLFTLHKDQDIRMGHLKIDPKTGVISQTIKWTACKVFQISPVSSRPVCYSSEALKYAQTSFFFGIVITQWYHALTCRTRKIPLKDIGLKNLFMVFGWASELALCFTLGYVLPINHVFGTRDLILPHFFMPAVPMGFVIVIWDETRKWFIRNWKQDDLRYPNWCERNLCT